MTSSRSYARAYLEVTTTLDPVEQLGWLLLFQDRSVRRTLTRILQQHDARTVLEGLAVPTPLARFLSVLADDRALGRLSTIAEQAEVLAVAAGRGLPARITTTAELTAQQRDAVRTTLGAQRKGPVVLAADTDPRLLGGFRLTIGHTRIDQSLASRLAQLKQTLVTT